MTRKVLKHFHSFDRDPDQLQSTNMGFPVLLQLHLKNWCCPLCIASEDRNAYQAVRVIQTTGSHVLFIERSAAESQKSRLFPNWFGGSSSTNNSGCNGTSSTKESNCDNGAKRARLLLQDSDVDGQPTIRFASARTEDDPETAGTRILLRRVDRVQLMDDYIVLYGKKPTEKGKDAPELLRFAVVLPGGGPEDDSSNSSPVLVSTDVRNELVHHWMVLVEWERQRRSKLSDAERDDDDEEEDTGGSKNIFVRQAQQAAHFAQREIELQRTKRDREQRKAKLIQEAGGLKYTAIAMANQK
jgi:hypothetical protein